MGFQLYHPERDLGLVEIPFEHGAEKLMVHEVLWDVGYYEIGYSFTDRDSDSDQERRRKRRRMAGHQEDEDDPYVCSR